jgi:hypothetical protein
MSMISCKKDVANILRLRIEAVERQIKFLCQRGTYISETQELYEKLWDLRLELIKEPNER